MGQRRKREGQEGAAITELLSDVRQFELARSGRIPSGSTSADIFNR